MAMITLLVRLSLVLLVLNLFFTPASCWGSSRGRVSENRQSNKGYVDPAKPKTFAGTSSGLPSQNTTRRGLGISAWGIIAIIVTLILAGTGLYYVSICYRICQPTNNKYDKMGPPTLA